MTTQISRDVVRLLSYVWPYRARLAAALLTLLAGTALALAAPQVVRMAIDDAVVTRDAGAVQVGGRQQFPKQSLPVQFRRMQEFRNSRSGPASRRQDQTGD